MLNGRLRSGFTDGPSAGTRTLPNGRTIDSDPGDQRRPTAGRRPAVPAAEINAVTADRPWGANNPRWQLFAHGPLSNLLPTGPRHSPFYVMVWVGDDPAETDGNPPADDATGTNPGSRGTVLLRAESFGPLGSHRRLEVATRGPWPS